MSEIDREAISDEAAIRTATASDSVALTTLGRTLAETDPYLILSGFDPVTGVALLRAFLGGSTQTGSDRIFVAEWGGEIVGLAICRRHPPPERETVLQFDLGIDPLYRRRGLGSGLVRHVLGWAQDTGLHRVQLAVVAENQEAVSLYKKHGFEIEGTLRQGIRLERQFHDIYVMATLLT